MTTTRGAVGTQESFILTEPRAALGTVSLDRDFAALLAAEVEGVEDLLDGQAVLAGAGHVWPLNEGGL